MANTGSLDFGILLNLAFGVFKTELESYLSDAGFSDVGPSFGYVFRLLAAEPMHLRLVADQLGITPQGALKLIDDMERRDYVERRDDPADGRVKQLLLTGRARKAMAAARRFHRRFERELTAQVGAESAAAVRAALEAIVARQSDGLMQSARPL